MNFRVLDETGKQVAIGRDLSRIRQDLGVQVRRTFAALPGGNWQRDNLTSWDFGDLPDKIEIKRHGMILAAYPALVDNKGSASLRLFDSSEASRAAHRTGVRRLFMRQLEQETKYLAKSLPGFSQMAINYSTIGPSDELRRDLVEASFDRALFEHDGPVRTKEQFVRLAEQGWKRLVQASHQIATTVAQTLETYQSIDRRLSVPPPSAFWPAWRDIKEQLNFLLPRGFVRTTPAAWMPHLPRFVKAIDIRLTKLANAGLSHDTQALQVMHPLWQAYLDRRQQHRQQDIDDPELDIARWMIEELRVSLFAQELKTSQPISPQRVQRQFDRVRK
jgi:ATP-dependent helicase HrpA